MLCLVSQADSIIIEVQVDSKAKGKQCLDKVSSALTKISNAAFALLLCFCL